jgi:hypothetical protein
MRGGVHESLKVYVIQKRLGRPKCFVIKKARRGFRDDIYLFFDKTLPKDEIKEFVYAAMGLESTVHIEPELDTNNPSDNKNFHNLFIRLRGFKSYSIESGLLSNSQRISKGSFTEHTISGTDTKMEKWGDVIKKLEEKSESKEGYTFTPFDDENFMEQNEVTTSDLDSLFNNIIKKTMSEIKEDCKDKPILKDIQQLNRFIETQSRITREMNYSSSLFRIGKSEIKDMEKDKENNISLARKRFPTWDDNILKAKYLIVQINKNQYLNQCRIVMDEGIMNMVSRYLDGRDTFKSIQEIANDSYNISY